MEMSQFTSPYLTWEMKLNNIKMKIFYSSQCVHFMTHIVLEHKIYLRGFFKVLQHLFELNVSNKNNLIFEAPLTVIS